MKKFAIYCVTYNSYAELADYLASIEEAAMRAADKIKVDVYVADNTVENFQDITFNASASTVRIFPYHENLGYLGGAQRMMRETDVAAYDYVAVSNVDLRMEKDALERLADLAVGENVGWIAPALYSNQLHYDRNPSVLKRYTKRRLQLIGCLFRFPILYYTYRATLYKRKKVRKTYDRPLEIYAGHGSCMIFTRSFIARCGVPNYPVFLYGEEIYFAEQCRAAGLSVVYQPSVRFSDKEHASISQLRKSTFFRYNYEANRYVLKTFYS